MREQRIHVEEEVEIVANEGENISEEELKPTPIPFRQMLMICIVTFVGTFC
jgi:hypothetical protein